jgi:2,3-bisphosphoglycerate-independent phosphoglycerate mutase
VDNQDQIQINDGKLGDLAPTILTLMGLPIPAEMTGNILLK